MGVCVCWSGYVFPLYMCICDSAAWVHLGLIDHREFQLNFWSDPLRLNAVLSPSSSRSFFPFLYLSPSAEREIETLELGSHWVGVSQLKCQTRRYHLGVYLKWKTVSVNLHFFSVTCGFGMNITGLLGVFIMLASMRNCPESQKVMATSCLCCLCWQTGKDRPIKSSI